MRPLPAYAAVLALLAAGAATAQSRTDTRSAAPITRAVVITSGNDPAIQIGDDVVARPFGASLVDSIAVVSSHTLGGISYHLVRGERASGCRVSYVVIRRERDGSAVATDPFGTCAPGATASVADGSLLVRVPAATRGGRTSTYRFEQGTMRPLDRAAARALPSAAAVDTCRQPTRSDPASNAAALASFDTDYPEAFRRTKTLDRVEIDPLELRTVVTGLACLSRWPGAERRVPRVATPLFASERHGKAAFALIDVIAQDPASDANLRASARAFGAEMRYRVDRIIPL